MIQIHKPLARRTYRFVLLLILVALSSLAYLSSRFSSHTTLAQTSKKARANQPIDGTNTASARHATVSSALSGSSQAKRKELYGKLPLNFVANRGQADSQVQFIARGSGYNLFLTPAEAVLTLPKRETGRDGAVANRQASHRDPVTVLRMKLVDADSTLRGEGLEELPGKTNYFAGSDPDKWQSNVPSYGRVRYQSIYPGVNLEYYGNQSQLEYDFVIAPGADPNIIKLSFEGARK